jgi:hypothetical protein
VILDDDTPPEKLSWRAGYEAHRSHRAADVFPMRAETFDRNRRARESGHPGHMLARLPWAPAYAGVTITSEMWLHTFANLRNVVLGAPTYPERAEKR